MYQITSPLRLPTRVFEEVRYRSVGNKPFMSHHKYEWSKAVGLRTTAHFIDYDALPLDWGGVANCPYIYISLKCNKPPFLLLSNECWISCFKNTSLWEIALVVIELTATKICQRKQIWWSHTQVLSALQIVITKKWQVLGADPERKAGVIADLVPPADFDPPVEIR